MRALFVLGRAVFGGYFVWNAVNLIVERQQMSQYASAKGVPTADVAVPASGALLLAGGLSIMAGFKPRQGLAAIIGFLIPVSLEMHRFWDVQDPQQRQIEMINFSKNMALIGAALMMLQLPEPWPVGVDDALPDREDMFIHLGGRELRALPA
jgi:putative oxidoreductase